MGRESCRRRDDSSFCLDNWMGVDTIHWASTRERRGVLRFQLSTYCVYETAPWREVGLELGREGERTQRWGFRSHYAMDTMWMDRITHREWVEQVKRIRKSWEISFWGAGRERRTNERKRWIIQRKIKRNKRTGRGEEGRRNFEEREVSSVTKIESDKAKKRFIGFSNRWHNDFLLESCSGEMGVEGILQPVRVETGSTGSISERLWSWRAGKRRQEKRCYQQKEKHMM